MSVTLISCHAIPINDEEAQASLRYITFSTLEKAIVDAIECGADDCLFVQGGIDAIDPKEWRGLWDTQREQLQAEKKRLQEIEAKERRRRQYQQLRAEFEGKDLKEQLVALAGVPEEMIVASLALCIARECERQQEATESEQESTLLGRIRQRVQSGHMKDSS